MPWTSELHAEFAETSCGVQPDGRYTVWLTPGRYHFAIGQSPPRRGTDGFPVLLYGWDEVAVAGTQTIDIRYSGSGKKTTATLR